VELRIIVYLLVKWPVLTIKINSDKYVEWIKNIDRIILTQKSWILVDWFLSYSQNTKNTGFCNLLRQWGDKKSVFCHLEPSHMSQSIIQMISWFLGSSVCYNTWYYQIMRFGAVSRALHMQNSWFQFFPGPMDILKSALQVSFTFKQQDSNAMAITFSRSMCMWWFRTITCIETAHCFLQINVHVMV
jgi:hypothetical protein